MRRISKFLCLVLIASMIASSVTSGIMPGNIVQAEESNEVPTIPFDMDFESDTAGSVPEGWIENSGHNSEDEECSSMQVVNDGDNKIVKFNQIATRSSAYYMHYYFEETDKAVLEYSFRAESNGNYAWLPSFTYNNDTGTTKPLYLMLMNGGTKIQYSANCATWYTTEPTLELGEWHTIKLVVDLTENVRELYIDESEVVLDGTEEARAHLTQYPCRSDYKLSSISGGFYSGIGSCTYYIDDLSVMEYVLVETITEAEIPFELDFENNVIGEVPEGWIENSNHKIEDATKSSMEVIADGDNKVVKFNQTSTRSSAYYMHYYLEETDKATLEYRFKAESNGNYGWLPSFTYNNDTGTTKPLYLMLMNGGTRVQYSANCSTWYTAKSNLTLGEWHTIKLVVNLTENVRDLYINGERISLVGTEETEAHLTQYPCRSDYKLSSISGGFYSGIGSCTYYIDDLSVTEYVPVETITEAEIPFALNFEDDVIGEIPEGWIEDSEHKIEDATKSSMEVIADGDNKVVKFNQTSTRSSAYYMHYYLEETDKATLEYRFKAESNGNYAWLPSFTYNDADTTKPLYLMLLNGGTRVQYSANCSTWYTAESNLTLGEWHTIKLVVNLTDNVRALYIDGRRITLGGSGDAKTHMETYPCRADYKLADVSSGFYSGISNCTFYIDDVSVSEYEDIIDVPFEFNFNDLPEGEIPVGWVENSAHSSADVDKSSMKVVTEGNNKVVEFEQTQKRSSSYYMHYYFDEVDKAVLEYRFKAANNANYAWLPAFVYNNQGTSEPLYLMLTNGGTMVQYSVNCANWYVAKSDLTVGLWHSIKLVVNLEENIRELYIDGKSVELDAEHMNAIACNNNYKINSISAGFYSGVDSSKYYIDDISVTNYVHGTSLTFEKTEYTIPKGGSVTLEPIFSPENTSVQGISYVSENTDIAIVDENGMVTGVVDGETVINVIPDLPSLPTIEINVTVDGVITGNITVDSSEILIPLNGHVVLDPVLELNSEANNGILYESEDPEIATVDEWGEIVALSVGTTTINLYAEVKEDIHAEVTVTVQEASVQKRIYVSPNGTGNGESSITPTNLAGAIAQLQNVNKENLSGNIEVVLLEGYYYQNQVLALNENHGGNNLYSVIFKAADGADVTIGGGVQIEGSEFEKYANTSIYVYDLTELGQNICSRQLYVDEVRAVRARSNEPLENVEFLYDADGKNIGFICDNTELLNYAKPADLELIFTNNWANRRCGVSEINERSDGKVELIMDQPGWSNVIRGTSSGANPDTLDYYENALELLDEPGEWYLDEDEDKLYYKPRSWENMNNVKFTIPLLDGEMINLSGTNANDQIQNVRFEGITFADTTWMRPSSTLGHNATQNNYICDNESDSVEGQSLVDAAVVIKHANGIQFVDCEFTRIGINAINMYDGVQNSKVEGNHFYDISGNAIAIGKPNYTGDVDNYNPSDTNMLMKNCDVINNYIHDIGVDYKSSSAVSVGFAANVDLCNNEIFNVPYCGFHIGYGWGNRFENVLKNVKICDNFIHDYLLEGVYDGGAVYTNGNSGGSIDNYNVVSNNYMRNQGEKVSPLYADNGSTYWIFSDNVVDISETAIGKSSRTAIQWGFVNSYSNHVKMVDNYTSSHRQSVGTPAENVVFSNNTVVENLNWPEKAATIINNSGLQSAYSGLRNNQIERLVTAIPTNGIDLKVGNTFNVQLTATDGKDRAVSLQNAIINYEIADESIATVTSSGVITAKKEGQTELSIYVVSNNILDVIKAKIYVGEEIESLLLREIDTNIVVYLNTNGQQMNPYGITKSGREVEFETITYSVGNTSIATISDEGYIIPVSSGTTTLSIEGEIGGYSKSNTFTLIVEESPFTEEEYLDDIFDSSNAEFWIGTDVSGSESTWQIVDGESITTNLSGFRTYTGTEYQNELLKFKMSLDAVGSWPSIVLRAQSSNVNVASGASGYIICMGDNGLQVQRFNGTSRTVFYGTVTGFTPQYGEDIYPHALIDNELHEIQVGAVNEENGVRIAMYIDGDEVFNFVDDSENAITEAGYFGLVGRNDTFTLEKMGMNVPEGNVITRGFNRILNSFKNIF